MTLKQQLENYLAHTYHTEDGGEYRIELKPGLSDKELNAFQSLLPGKLPEEYLELLKFTRGFEFYLLEEVSFDGIGQFGLENIFSQSIQLAHDGLGNFWILDLDSKGNFGKVFYICHDPSVIIKQADSVLEFLQQIHEFALTPDASTLNVIYETTTYEIWKNDSLPVESEIFKTSMDKILKEFSLSLPDNFLIADMRNTVHKTGFCYGRSATDIGKIVRLGDQQLWAIPKPHTRTFWEKLFGK